MTRDMLREGGETPRHHTQAKKTVSYVRTLQATNFLIQNNSLKALIRDDFQCIVSGNYDSRSVLMEEVEKSRSILTITLCAHIFP